MLITLCTIIALFGKYPLTLQVWALEAIPDTHKLYMTVAVLVQIPTVKPAPKPVGMRTGKHTQSATPHTSGRCAAYREGVHQ
jgi:hypothetical protein